MRACGRCPRKLRFHMVRTHQRRHSGASGWGALGKNKNHQKVVLIFGSPNRIRTGVLALKGRCPRPLDDGAKTALFMSNAGKL